MDISYQKTKIMTKAKKKCGGEKKKTNTVAVPFTLSVNNTGLKESLLLQENCQLLYWPTSIWIDS